MAYAIQKKLEPLGLVLPEPAAPAATYDPFVISGNQVFISGQLPMYKGKLHYQGVVGKDVSIEEAIKSAELCGLNILAQLSEAVGGDFSKVKRCLKIGGFVNAVPEFTDHPKIINGVSELMIHVFGDQGRHARYAVGAGSLPFNVSVEVEALFELSSDDA